jgi:hypothetical protein
MERNEKLIIIRDVPAAIVDALDGVMATQGLLRIAMREIEEDWTPLLAETGGPIAFVLSQPHNEWTACFSSLDPDDEWMLSEALAAGLEQPTVYALLSDATGTYAYRYFEDGVLHEEFLPGAADDEQIDAAGLLERLARHSIPIELIDDRTLTFGAEHILLGYGSERDLQAGLHQRDEDREFDPEQDA